MVFNEINNFFLQIRDKCRELVLTDAQVKEIMSRLLNDLNKGLGKKTHAESIVKCFVTYVQDLPNGKGNEIFLNIQISRPVITGYRAELNIKL